MTKRFLQLGVQLIPHVYPLKCELIIMHRVYKDLKDNRLIVLFVSQTLYENLASKACPLPIYLN